MSFFLVHVGLPCGWTGSFAFNCSKWQEAKEKAHSLPSWNLLYSCFTWGTNWRNWFSLTGKMTRNLSKSTRHYLHLQLTGNSSHFLIPACSGQGYWGRAAVLGRTFFFYQDTPEGNPPQFLWQSLAALTAWPQGLLKPWPNCIFQDTQQTCPDPETLTWLCGHAGLLSEEQILNVSSNNMLLNWCQLSTQPIFQDLHCNAKNQASSPAQVNSNTAQRKLT